MRVLYLHVCRLHLRGGFSTMTASRRAFVRLLGFAAGASLLAACSPSAPAQPTAPPAAAPKPTTAPAAPAAAATSAPAAAAATTAPAAAATSAPKPAAAAPTTFNEAPQLAQMVKDGKLPEVAKRLPENP